VSSARGFSTSTQRGSTVTWSLPLPWTRLAALVGGSIAVTFITTAVALLFLRAATDPAELRVAA
jgi:hypothetical protein